MPENKKKDMPQTQLYSMLDYGKGLFNMSIPEAQNSNLKSMTYYKATQISLNLNQLDYRDMLKFHDKVTKILHKDVERTHVSEKKLQDKLDEVEKQLKQERTMVKAKNNKIKEYEKNDHTFGQPP